MHIAGWPLRLIWMSTLLLSMVGLNGCGIGYLWHVTVGQATILFHQRPVEDVLHDARLTPQEQHKLHLILAVRSFAITQLDLHESKSYTTFVQLDRPYVSYNLSAAAPDAFKPYVWRFPILGRMPYKGFFDKDYALHEQHALEEQAYDTYLRRLQAYSAFGCCTDPTLTTMLS